MKVKRLVEKIRSERAIDYATPATEDGCTIYNWSCDSERYVVDFADDFTTEGWKQFDTDQDAHYFGVWINPQTFQVLTYAEGDWTVTDCHNRDRYRREIERLIEFHGAGRIATVIDADGTVTVYSQDRSEFLNS